MKMEHNFADYVDEKGVSKIQALEQELGNTLIAYRTPPQPANLPDEKLAKIKKLEKQLCVRLVAYENH
ncbi:hypothetical protein D1AOALGA4SA_1839 [Olavius algarvensis Delta 1 endosymbiont]|nr:hypothetical protein D1AOALGA4SA_1839 [Olavius algarvensis Delta 1 endosymbiont]